MLNKKFFELTLEEKLTWLISTVKDVRLLKDVNDVWWAQFPSLDGPSSICDEDFTNLIDRAFVITQVNEKSRQYESESHLLKTE